MLSRLLIPALVVISTAAAFPASAQDLHYTLAMPEPHTHYFEVTLELTAENREFIDFKMPTWAPGSYLIREFSRNVENFRASGRKGELPQEQISKNTWRVYTQENKDLKITYRVYAFEMSVRTSFLDADHGYVNGTSIFMYPANGLDQSLHLTILPPPQWKVVTTGLEALKGRSFQYRSPNYEKLVDSPIEIGNHDVYHFEAAGTQHTVAIFGKGNFQVETLLEDMSTIVEKTTRVFGTNPNPDYTFIIHNIEKATGGLEHGNSTTIQVNRWTYQPRSRYVRFLGTVAHEYFHLWNVKRLKPANFIPYDYEAENYTRLLWLMEGFTDYYDLLLVYSAGLMSESLFHDKLAALINHVENSPGNQVHSVAEASFNAWIKAYRRDENFQNSSISYYSKGALIALNMDLAILQSTNGTQSLDDLMRYLYKEYFEKQYVGLTEGQLIRAASQFMGEKAPEFFDDFVYHTGSLRSDEYLRHVGFTLQDQADSTHIALGVSFKSGTDLVVSQVTRGSSAHEGGVNVGDEWIALDGFRVHDSNYLDILGLKEIGDSLSVDYVRNGQLRSLKLRIGKNPFHEYSVVPLDHPTTEQLRLQKLWLRNP